MDKMDVEPDRISLSSTLKARTRTLHVQAERSGFVAEMLHGRATRPAYALYLRNLLPAYQQLERGLERLRETALLAELALRPVYRASALTSDLDVLWGACWRTDLPLLPSAERYADGIAHAAQGAGVALIGHAYVRYLGDLSGGQVLKRLLAGSLDLSPDSLSFYDFPEIDDLAAFKRSYREALDRSADAIANPEDVVEAALWAFAMNIEVSDAVRRTSANRNSDLGSG